MAALSLRSSFGWLGGFFKQKGPSTPSASKVDGYAEARRIYRETNGPTPELRAMYKEFRANRVLVVGVESSSPSRKRHRQGA